MLVEGFGLPITDMKSTEDVLNSLGYFNLGTVTKELVHGSLLSDHILEYVHKLLLGLHTIYIGDHGISTNKQLCYGLPVLMAGVLE